MTLEELADAVETTGCSADVGSPATWRGHARDRNPPEPAGKELAPVRDEMHRRVDALLSELPDRAGVATRRRVNGARPV